MGAGASSGGASPSTARPGNGASSIGNSDRITGTNASSGAYSSMGQASRASVSPDYTSPKQPKHVAIQAADSKTSSKQPQRGGLIDKIRQRTSQNNSSNDTSTANSRVGSQPCSQAGSGSQYGSEKIVHRTGRRDEYDVDSDDEDLDGFIYDDDSTSEDEREDYVNAFSRKKKPAMGQDYSDYEGAAVRALTAGQRKAAVRRTRSSTDDGDDEWDAEEDRIRQLRHLKKAEDRAKAAAAAAAAAAKEAGVPVACGKRAAGAAPAMQAATSTPAALAAAAAAAATSRSTPGWDCASSQRQQPSQPPQGARIGPQPPSEPPARTSSGSLRRQAPGAGAAAAAAAAAGGNGYGGGAAGTGPGPAPGQGPGPVGRLAGPDHAPAGAALEGSGGRGAGLRPAPPAAAPANLGASASSQYWQAKRCQNGGAEANAEAAGPGALSRLEQLAALQKKRQADAGPAAAAAAGSQAGDAGNRGGGGLRWQEGAATAAPSEPAAAAAAVSPQQLKISEAPATQPPPEPQALQPQRQQQQQEQQQQEQQQEQQGDGVAAAVVPRRRSEGSRKWAPLQRTDEKKASAAPPTQQQQQQQPEPGDAGLWPRKNLEGQSFIKHLEPPSQRQHPHKAKSRGQAQPLLAGAEGLHPPPLTLPPPFIRACSDVTDFDVDEVLNSFSPSAAAEPQQPQQEPPPPQQQQQWAGTRPQPQPACLPGDGGGKGQAPQHKRSIRAVQSDFTSMLVNDVADGVSDLTGRVLSLPLQASRPSGAGGPLGQSPAASPHVTVSSAPVAVSRFARMGANMFGQQGTQDGSGMSSAPVAGVAAGGTGGVSNGDYRASGTGATAATAAAVPAPSAYGAGAGQVGTMAAARRPRRSPASNDGTTLPMSTSLSVPTGDGGGVAGQSPPARTGMAHGGRAGPSGGGDSTLVLPALRPSSGGAGSILNGPTAVAAVGRSRFGAAQHQQLQQEVMRTSLPVMTSQRDYDSDSALSKPSGTVRYSYNGAVGGAGGAAGGRDAFRTTYPPSVGLDSSGVPFGAAARTRLGQVGA